MIAKTQLERNHFDKKWTYKIIVDREFVSLILLHGFFNSCKISIKQNYGDVAWVELLIEISCCFGKEK